MKNRKILSLLAATLSTFLILSGCSSSSDSSEDTAQEVSEEVTQDEEAEEEAEAEEEETEAEEEEAESEEEEAEAKEEEEAEAAAEETLVGVGSGFGGDVTVTLIVAGDTITDCSIDGPDETESVGGAALEELAVQVVAANGADIDGVSGATYTSNGVIEAVTAALSGVGSQEEEGGSEELSEIEYDGTLIRVGSLKGPTTMGIVNLMQDAEEATSIGTYSFTMESDASLIMASIVSGDLDIAMIPANTAANIYNKTEGGVSVIDLNTLGVLYCVTSDETITSMEDLAGRSVLTTGQGATPEYIINYLLDSYDVEDCTLEFYSEASEVAALLAEDPSQIAILPQPYASVAVIQNEELTTAFSLTDEWDAVVENGAMIVTGATIVRNEFLEEHPDAVAIFLKEHAASAAEAVSDVEGTAELVVSYGILEKAAIAQQAIPKCNLVCITGEEMKTALTGYLSILYDSDPSSVGGSLPDDDFYYITQ